MRSQRNTIPTQKSFGPVAAYLAAGSGAPTPWDRGAWDLALNRADDQAELALCFVSLAGTVPEWIELVPAGKVTGADRRTFTNDDPAAFVAMSHKLKRIPAGWCIDRDHQLQLAANEKVGGTAPANGWITQLEVRNGAVWGKVEWTDLGTDAIEKKHYRGISPVFAIDKKGRALGLVSAALTNNPNLDLVALNARQLSQQENGSMPDWLKELLGLAKDASDEQVKTALNAFTALAGALATALGVDVKAAVALNGEALNATLARKFGSGNDVLVALCTKAGVKADAGAEAILTALQTPDPAKFVPIATHTALKTELDGLKASKTTELVDVALKDGRLVPAQKDWALNYAQRDPEGFKTFLSQSPAKLGDITPPKTVALDANDAKAVAAAAQAHVAEQAKAGIVISTTAAVAHVLRKGA